MAAKPNYCEECRMRIVPQHRTKCPQCLRAKTKRRGFYHWYISMSPAWEVKRQAVWQRAREHNQGKCELCKENHGYAVHHLTYDRLGDEDLRDLLLLCEECHSTLHHRNPENLERVRRFVEFFDPKILGLTSTT